MAPPSITWRVTGGARMAARWTFCALIPGWAESRPAPDWPERTEAFNSADLWTHDEDGSVRSEAHTGSPATGAAGVARKGSRWCLRVGPDVGRIPVRGEPAWPCARTVGPMTERRRQPRTPPRRRLPVVRQPEEGTTAHALIALQHGAGNAAVARLLNPTRRPGVVPAAPPAPTARPVVLRDDVPEVTSARYVETFGAQIGNGVRDFLAGQEFPLGQTELSWSDPDVFVRDALSGGGPLSTGGSGGAALAARLPDLLRPLDVGVLVNRGRKRGTEVDPDTKISWEHGDTGPEKWFPDVAVELGQELATRIAASLTRMVPRYLEARVAAAVAAEAALHKSLRKAPEPTGPLLTSEPVDELVAAGLRSGNVVFDWTGYQAAHPGALGKVQAPRQVVFDVEPAQDHTYWIRVTQPADPTPEEVALALFGSTTMTDHVGVSAPPLFGFGDARPLRPAARAAFTALGINLDLAGDPAAAAFSGPLADEIALGQAKVVPGAAKADVLATIGQNLLILDKFDELGAPFGLGRDPSLGGIAPVRTKLLAKRKELATADETIAAGWSGQAAAQQSVLSQASFGLGGLAERFESMTKTVKDATAKLGGFTLPEETRTAFHDAVTLYVEAAAASFFPQLGEQKLELADQANRLMPVRILEGTLAGIRHAADDALTDKRKENGQHASYDTDGLRRREITLRAKLADARQLLLRDPTAAGEVLGKLQQEILDLQTEAEMVTNMDQLDAAWQALSDAVGIFVLLQQHREDRRVVGRDRVLAQPLEDDLQPVADR